MILKGNDPRAEFEREYGLSGLDEKGAPAPPKTGAPNPLPSPSPRPASPRAPKPAAPRKPIWRRILSWTSWIGAAGYVLLYIGVPIHFYFTYAESPREGWRAVEPGAEALPYPVQGYFDQTGGDLKKIGFNPELLLIHENSSKTILNFGLLYFNPSEQAHAQVLAGYFTKTERKQLRSYSIEYTTLLQSGEEIDTTNRDEVRVYAETPSKRIVFFPEAEDPAALFKLHQQHVKLANPGQTPLAGSPKHYREFVFLTLEKEIADQIPTGYVQRDPARPGYYRMTLKGSFLMIWKLLPPWHQILKHNQDKASRLVKEQIKAGEDAPGAAPAKGGYEAPAGEPMAASSARFPQPQSG